MSTKRPRLFQLLERASHAVRQQLDREARSKFGVSTVHVGALLHLAKHDGCLSKELADALNIGPSAVSGLVDRMEEAGLVKRRACADDARAQRIHMTAAGKTAVGKALPLIAELQARLTEGFTAEEIDVVARFLAAAAEREL